jgi:hypothetical protein
MARKSMRSTFLFFAAAVALLACDEKPEKSSSPAPSSAASPGEQPTSRAKPRPPPSVPASAAASAGKPEGSAATNADDASDPVLSFAGFSKDGKRFAYASGSASGAPVTFLWVTETGSQTAKVGLSVDLDYQGALGEAREFLKMEGFSGERRAPPAELKLKADLTATPPTVTLELEGRKKTSPVGTAPHPETDKATLWGLSPDGKHVAIRIHGPAVLARGGAQSAPQAAPPRTVTFYRVVPLP